MVKQRLHAPPSVQMAYLAALAAARARTRWSTDPLVEGDVALVLCPSSTTAAKPAGPMTCGGGTRVGFVGLAASKMPELFIDHADFVVAGEPEEAVARMLDGEELRGLVQSAPLDNLDQLPFPRWDLIGGSSNRTRTGRLTVRPLGGGFPVLASRGCPEFCTYCPHRIRPATARDGRQHVEELERLRALPASVCDFRIRCSRRTANVPGVGEAILSRDSLRFMQTRLDRLDPSLLSRCIAPVAGDQLRRRIGCGRYAEKAGRRPIPPRHQREVVDFCRDLGIATAAFYVFGFIRIRTSIAHTIDYAINLGSTWPNSRS
jgi:hypothetical protein